MEHTDVTFAALLAGVRRWCGRQIGAAEAGESAARTDFYVAVLRAVHARLPALQGAGEACTCPVAARLVRRLLTSSSAALSVALVVAVLEAHDRHYAAEGVAVSVAPPADFALDENAVEAALLACSDGGGAPLAPGRVLIAAGSDSSGGAGIQADLKVCEAVGAFGMTAVTALTAQNTHGVTGVELISAAFVKLQMEACETDVGADVIKTGMLPDPATVEMIAAFAAAKRLPLVVDPVMVSASGCKLASSGTVVAMKAALLPRALVATPNLPEAAVLLDREGVDMAEFCPSAEAMPGICKALYAACGAEYILLKGGHMDEVSPGSPPAACTDVLYHGPSGAVRTYTAPWVPTTNTHGTGCTMASCVAAHLAKGFSVPDAVESTKRYLTATLRRSAGATLGTGPHHPMLHSPFFA